MRYIRRSLQVVALVGTLLVGILALALIVSQTPWFRDWLRRYIVRESKQYVNGELSIGGLSGNLLFGIGLSDVAVDVSGQRVVAVKSLQVDYSVFQILSQGIIIDDIKIISPSLRVERDPSGWNLAHLVKEQAQEADRKGPAKPISLSSIELTDGTIDIADKVGSTAYTLPSHLGGLHVKGRFEYAPVHYSIVLDDVRFQGTSPDLTLQQLSGAIALRDDNLYLQKIGVRTGASTVAIDGVIESYLKTPVMQLTANGTASLPELSAVVPALEGYGLTPAFDVKTNGRTDRLALDLRVQSQAGNIGGKVTADLAAPDLGVKGVVDVERLNLAPLLKDPAQRSDLTGHAQMDLTLASAPEAAPSLDRLRGTFAFNGPKAVAAGYQAADVLVTGGIAGRRITLDGRAAAYGGTATTTGFILIPEAGGDVSFDLKGRAAGVDLRRLPATTGAPKLATNITATSYHVSRTGGRIEGTAALGRSTVEGATIGDGTVADFSVSNGNVTYAARGDVSDLNLQRVGQAFNVAALNTPQYESRLNGSFDVKGTVTPTTTRSARSKANPKAGSDATLTVDATGTLRDSDLWGAHLPQLGYEAHLNGNALDARARGRIEHLDPARLSGKDTLKGVINGDVDVHAQIADVTAPITPESIAADGRVTLDASNLVDLQIDTAEIEGHYASQTGELTRFTLAGPAVKADASGRIALDRASSSDVRYHVEAIDVPALAKLAGQEGVTGTAVLDGTLTGNMTALQTNGTMKGNGLGYQESSALEVTSQYSVTVPDLAFDKAQVKATTNGTFVKVGGLELNEVKATATYADSKLGFETNVKQEGRELDASGDVVFHPDHQEIHLPSLALRTQGIEWRTAPGSAAALQYGNDRIEMQGVKLVSGDQSLSADGVLSLKGADPNAALTVQVSNVDIQQLQQLALQDRGLTGRLNATATIRGTTEKPAVSGNAVISGGGFREYKYESLTAQIDYTSTAIGIDATLRQSASQALMVKGQVPMTLFRRSGAEHVAASSGDSIDLRITSTPINLGLVQGFTTAVTNVSGQLIVDVRLTGAGEDPHLEGIVDISGGAFAVPATGVSYSGLNTSIALSPQGATIPNLQIVDEEGERMTITGTLAMHAREVGAVNVTVNSRNFELIDNELGDVGVETNLKLTGELRRPRIEGDVKLQAARLEVDKIVAMFYDPYAETAMADVAATEQIAGATANDSNSGAEASTRQALSRAQEAAAPVAAQEAAGQEAPSAPAGAFGPVELKVHVRVPENLVLRGKAIRPGGPTGPALGDINITVGGDVDITKEADAPVILLGSVDTVRGTYQFQGRRFDLVRGGTVRFTGEPTINPLLDISATRDIPNTGIQARVHITGSAKTPELDLTSTPPLDESDILALIVFNRPVNELASGERTSLAATAGGIATGFLAAPLGASIGRALDLDLFEITTSTDTGEMGAGITVGQQVGDRTFIKLRQQFGERTTSEFMVDFQLTDFLRMEGKGAPETTGSANRLGQRRIERAGVDLIFFFSY